MLDVEIEVDMDDDVNCEEARGREPSKDSEQLRVQILRVPSLSLLAPSSLQYTTGIKVLAVGGGGIRVLLYGIAGGWYSELGVRLAGVVAW